MIGNESRDIYYICTRCLPIYQTSLQMKGYYESPPDSPDVISDEQQRTLAGIFYRNVGLFEEKTLISGTAKRFKIFVNSDQSELPLVESLPVVQSDKAVFHATTRSQQRAQAQQLQHRIIRMIMFPPPPRQFTHVLVPNPPVQSVSHPHRQKKTDVSGSRRTSSHQSARPPLITTAHSTPPFTTRSKTQRLIEKP
jgi:hypothetical protein